MIRADEPVLGVDRWLADHGWYPGRDIGERADELIAFRMRDAERQGCALTVATSASRFLHSFGLLALAHPKTPESSLIIDPRGRYEGDAEDIVELGAKLGRKLFPVGFESADSSVLLIDEGGRFFYLHHTGAYYAGANSLDMFARFVNNVDAPDAEVCFGYAFLAAGDGVQERLSATLAEAFGVPAADTDVSAASEMESRNWAAVVTCEYETLAGDLPWSLSIYAAEEVKLRPSEEHLALRLARELGTPVFFAWRAVVPWIRRVAQPNGGLTLARVAERGDQIGFSVEAAEAPIAGLPGLRVTHFPEVVRAFEIPTPVTDAVAPRGVDDTQDRVRGLLVNWERLCVRMRSEWPPSNWYSATMYREDLEYRDRLGAVLKDLPETERMRVGEALRKLDSLYQELTIEDGGQAIGAGDSAGQAWYWYRRPRVLPWASDEPE